MLNFIYLFFFIISFLSDFKSDSSKFKFFKFSNNFSFFGFNKNLMTTYYKKKIFNNLLCKKIYPLDKLHSINYLKENSKFSFPRIKILDYEDLKIPFKKNSINYLKKTEISENSNPKKYKIYSDFIEELLKKFNLSLSREKIIPEKSIEESLSENEIQLLALKQEDFDILKNRSLFLSISDNPYNYKNANYKLIHFEIPKVDEIRNFNNNTNKDDVVLVKNYKKMPYLASKNILTKKIKKIKRIKIN